MNSKEGEATDEEMRAAVEQWARARGLVMHGREGYEPWAGGRWGLHVNPLPPRSTLLVCPNGDELAGAEVSPHAALVWALVLEARPQRDGTRCKRCRGRGTWDELTQTWSATVGPVEFQRRSVEIAREFYEREGWAHDAWWRPSGRVVVVASRTIPCPDCDGTGLADLTDAFAQHVLAASVGPAVVRLSITGPCPDCASQSSEFAACRRCRGRREWSRWSQAETLYFAWPRGVQVDPHVNDDGGTLRLGDPLDGWPFGTRLRWASAKISRGNKTSIEALHMLADQMQGWECTSCCRWVMSSVECHWCRGHTRPSPHRALGLHLAHFLAGEREGTAAAVERVCQLAGAVPA